MRVKKFIILVLIAITGSVAWYYDSLQAEKAMPPAPELWAGTYKGTLPCASCSGIETTLTLAKDSHYQLKQFYQGKEEKITTEQGDFSWGDDGKSIILKSGNRYLVENKQLLMLDQSGNKIKSSFADKYILKQVIEK